MNQPSSTDPSTRQDSLLEFPCAFPIKILGKQHDELAQQISVVILRHAPDFDMAQIEIRASKNQRYISLTCTIQAISRDQLDALYRELCDHPLVSVVL